MGRQLFMFWFAILILLFVASPVLAESEEVKITADELIYNYHCKQMEASGNVRIVYKDITVECEYAFMDQNQNVLVAKKTVRITKNDSNYNGDLFLYYLRDERGLLSPIQAEIRDAEINGPVQMQAVEAFFKGDTVTIMNSTFSGCDREHPHYHFKAKEVEYHPEDRVILRQVWYVEHRVPLFYLPYFFISLKPDRENFEFEIGHNQMEGWFVKIGYNYIWDDKNFGKVTTRLTEQGSDMLGVRHYTDFSPVSRFYQDYNYINNRKLGFSNPDYKIGFGYENAANSDLKYLITVEDWSQSYFYYGGVQHELPQHKRALNFQLNGQSPYPVLNLKFTDNTGTGEYMDDLSGSWVYNPDPTMNISLNSRWYYEDKLDLYTGIPFDITLIPHIAVNSFKYSASLRKDWIWSNLMFNYDETKVYSGNIGSYNVKPDIIYTIPKWKWPLIGEVKVAGEYLYVEKVAQNEVQDYGKRWALDIQRSAINIWKTGQLTLDWNSNFLYRFFSNTNSASNIDTPVDSELYAFCTNLGLINQFTKEFSTVFKLGYTGTDGIANDFFGKPGDNTLNGFFITNEWKWQSPTFNALLNTGYNFTNDQANPVTLAARWTPAPGQEVSFNTVYDWIFGLGMTTLSVNYNPRENWRLTVNAGYDFSRSLWTGKQFEALIMQQISAKWQMELIAKYDTLRDAFTDAQTGFAYDWHCRKLKIHYNWLNNEYWLQLTFNVLPDVPLKYSSESQFEGFFDAI